MTPVWLELTRDGGEAVLLNFAHAAVVEPARGMMGKGDKCRVRFAEENGSGGLSSIVVEESYAEVSARLHAALHPETEA